MKYYHKLLKYIYNCITKKLKNIIDKNVYLQINIKIVNNIIGFNDIISILLIFEIYLQIIDLDFLTINII